MLKRFLISFTMVAIVAILVTSTVFADQSTPHNGSFPPGFNPNSQTNDPLYIQKLNKAQGISTDALFPSTVGVDKQILYLGTSGEYQEPNNAA